MSRTYRGVMAAVWPLVRGWGRLQVVGAEELPSSGPTVLVANHDSAWDPLVIAAAVRRRRQIRALARSDLWNSRLLGRVLDAMGQIPIDRGRGDADAIGVAVAELAAGACIGVFPEGTVSRGRRLRARSGAGRLALAVPQARLVCVAVTGTLDIARVPRRPRLRVHFFPPTGGARQPGESASELAARLMADIRLRAPVPAYPVRRRQRFGTTPQPPDHPASRVDLPVQ
jgi:1-acyl-sn-glycerol-3-phosphate acyltransferase